MPSPGRLPLPKIRVSAYLRRPDTAGFFSVRLIAHFHNTSFTVSPGVKILPERTEKNRKPERLWDPATLRVSARHPDADLVNERLSYWQQRMHEAFRQLSGEGGFTLVTQAMMEAYLFPQAAATAQKADPGRLTFEQHYQAWASENAGILRENYTRKFRSVAHLLMQFRPGTVAGDLSEEFVRDYLRYLLARGNTDATISHQFKFLRIVAERLGLPASAKWLRYTEQTGMQLDLTKEELQQLIRATMPTPALEQERDVWLLQCFAGRRDGDMEALTREQLEQLATPAGPIPVLRHAQQKTSQLTLAPLPPIAVAIAEKYGWQLPVRSNQLRNAYLKKVGAAAGLNRVFNQMRSSNGVIKNNYRPICELLSTHTARHTCASLLLEGSDGDKSLASFVLGHTSRDVTDRYAKDKVSRVAPKVLRAWQAVLGECYAGLPG